MDALLEKLQKLKEEGLLRSKERKRKGKEREKERSRVYYQRKAERKRKQAALLKLENEICQGKRALVNLEKCDIGKKNNSEFKGDQNLHSDSEEEFTQDDATVTTEPHIAGDFNQIPFIAIKRCDYSSESNKESVRLKSDGDFYDKVEVEASHDTKSVHPVKLSPTKRNTSGIDTVNSAKSTENVKRARVEAYLNDFKQIPLIVLERYDWPVKEKNVLESQAASMKNEPFSADHGVNCRPGFCNMKESKNFNSENDPPVYSDADECSSSEASEEIISDTHYVPNIFPHGRKMGRWSPTVKLNDLFPKNHASLQDVWLLSDKSSPCIYSKGSFKVMQEKRMGRKQKSIERRSSGRLSSKGYKKRTLVNQSI